MHAVSRAAVPVVVLVSGSGTLLQGLIEATSDAGYGIVIAAVGSDRDDSGGLRRAQRAGIPTFVCAVSDYADRGEWDEALAGQMKRHLPRPDGGVRGWAVSAGFMKVLGSGVLDTCTVLNAHPALLPSFPGGHAVRDALAHGVAVTGATVHLVDAGIDTGPIVAQRAVPVRDGDDESSLHERIKVVERDLLVRTLHRLVTRGHTITDRKVALS